MIRNIINRTKKEHIAMSTLSLRKPVCVLTSLFVLLLLSACARNSVIPQAATSDWYSGGAASVEAASRRTYNNTP